MMKNKNFWIIVLLIVVGVALRLFYVTTFFIIDGDSAAAGLLAKHILEGREFPIYPPLAHYGGTLNSYAEALFFWFFGVSTLSLQVVGFLFSCLWGLTAYLLARRAFGFSSAMSALLFIVFADRCLCGNFYFYASVAFLAFAMEPGPRAAPVFEFLAGSIFGRGIVADALDGTCGIDGGDCFSASEKKSVFKGDFVVCAGFFNRLFSGYHL
jgi:hypothetical protein